MKAQCSPDGEVGNVEERDKKLSVEEPKKITGESGWRYVQGPARVRQRALVRGEHINPSLPHQYHHAPNAHSQVPLFRAPDQLQNLSRHYMKRTA